MLIVDSGLRIFDPGWKKMTLYVLCTVCFESGNWLWLCICWLWIRVYEFLIRAGKIWYVMYCWLSVLILRISWIFDPGWDFLIFDVLLIVYLGSENFWSGLEKFDIRCIVTCLNHSGTMPNFARSNAYSVFPFTTFTFVSRPSATMLLTSPFQFGGSWEVVCVLVIVFSGDLYLFICSCGTQRMIFTCVELDW